MQLNPIQVLYHLKDIGITHLYHANTVRTACTFINVGGLLSRGAVESFGHEQTPQELSDEIDRRYNVWNDIFLDSQDLHGEVFPRENRYGPVVFKLSLKVLEHPNLPPLWVTKDNPTRWYDEQLENERYMQNIDEFKGDYLCGSYREMITLRNTERYLPFDPFLEEIILDNPFLKLVKDGRVLFEEGTTALRKALENTPHNLSHVKRTARVCNGYCWCKENYKKYSAQELIMKFFSN